MKPKIGEGHKSYFEAGRVAIGAFGGRDGIGRETLNREEIVPGVEMPPETRIG